MATAPDPRRLAARQKAEAAQAMRWVVDLGDEQVTFRMADVTALDVGALRKVAGMSVSEAILLASAGEIDGVAALIWLARRQAGEKPSWPQIAESLTLDHEIIITPEDQPEAAEEVDALDPPG